MNRRILFSLIQRNIRLFFKDKGMFLTSLITPVILLVLYSTFLGDVYKDAFVSGIPEGVVIPEKILDGLVSSQLVSSILAVSCVTVTFCSNMVSVQDKASGALRDFEVSPIKSQTLALGYYFATLVSSLIICFAGMGVCFIYIGIMGWYLSALDVLFVALDIVLLVSFATAVSSIINLFLSTQGQISAVGTIVSSGYGFLCGAYMPLSQFSAGLQKLISFLPGTHGTSVMREYCMNGAFLALEKDGVPKDLIEEMKNAVDCNLYVFENKVESGAKFLILALSVVAFTLVYAIISGKRAKEK